MPSSTSEEIMFFVNGRKVCQFILSEMFMCHFSSHIVHEAMFCVTFRPFAAHTMTQINPLDSSKVFVYITTFSRFFTGCRAKSTTWDDFAWISAKPLYLLTLQNIIVQFSCAEFGVLILRYVTDRRFVFHKSSFIFIGRSWSVARSSGETLTNIQVYIVVARFDDLSFINTAWFRQTIPRSWRM